jgi:hypothetical protein
LHEIFTEESDMEWLVCRCANLDLVNLLVFEVITCQVRVVAGE